jgi:radical SAM superfamily enzyme YgiQ (UPF0313 family)
MRILLLTPPMTQLNTPYPATAYLTGFLRERGGADVEVVQADPAIELFLRVFSRDGLQRALDTLRERASEMGVDDDYEGVPPPIAHFLEHGDACVALIEPVIRFLQGRDPSLALRIAGGDFLPEGPRFEALRAQDDTLSWAFGALGTTDRARHLASLFIDDMADVIREGIDPRFELSRYGEKLAASAPTFDPIVEALDDEPTLIDETLDAITRELLEAHRPELIGLTVPFPGNVYGAFRIARTVKEATPSVKVVMGGGYVNTELRQLSDPRVFELCDYITLDDGERPMLALLDHLRDASKPLFRTFVRRDGRVCFETTDTLHDIPHRDAGTPTYDGLPLARYVSLFEMLNPMHRLWADGRWNKLTIAHGCYWKKCSFCDITLDYIGRYDGAPADVLVDRIEALVRETGQTGFHFVDEAAPPAALKAVAERLIARRVTITWWGNIRFEKTFTPELTALLAKSGCVAISGGLEVASDRLLKLMEKGVTVEQVARVTRAFTDAGVLVHAYLMYGFPTETTQETIDALERVRQLFAEGCIHSGFWHRFAATAHSPIGKRPDLFGIRLSREPEVSFARNEVAFTDPVGTDHEWLGAGLRKALYNYMHGLGLDADVRSWFEDDARPQRRFAGRNARRGTKAPTRGRTVPAAQVAPDLISRALRG